MPTRAGLLRYLWDEVINAPLRDDAIDNTIASFNRDSPDAPFGEVGGILKKLLASGTSRRDLALLQRFAAYAAVFSTLYALDDPGVDDDDVFMLHEELLGADPTGMEGRPGSADKSRS
jgi:hypothetical protein